MGWISNKYVGISSFFEKTWIGKFILNLINSLKNNPDGFASKKLISWTGMGLYIYVIVQWTNSSVAKGWDNLSIATVLGSLVGLIIGHGAMNVWDKNINGQGPSTVDDDTTVDTSTTVVSTTATATQINS